MTTTQIKNINGVNEILLRRKCKVLLSPVFTETFAVTPSVLAAALKNLQHYGFTFSSDLADECVSRGHGFTVLAAGRCGVFSPA